MKNLLIALMLLISNLVFAQDIVNDEGDDNPREDYRFGVSLNLGGPTSILSGSINYFITPNINIEGGLGFLGRYAGSQYHFYGKKQKNTSGYIGLFVARTEGLNLSGGGATVKDGTGLYIPVGFQYMTDKGFHFGLEVAVIGFDYLFGAPAWAALKIGKHF